MNLTQKIHHFVKDQYVNSNQKQASIAYNKVKQKNYYKYPKAKNKLVSDYELGYKYAVNDLKNLKRFRTFPKDSVRFVNLITRGRVVEISQFIKGYNNAKKEVR